MKQSELEAILLRIATGIRRLEKMHGKIIKAHEVSPSCNAFKFKDGATYRVKTERTFGKATLDGT